MRKPTSMRRTPSSVPIAVIRTEDLPKQTAALAKAVARLHRDAIHAETVLPILGPEAIRVALDRWRGRSLRDLSRATGLSPTYLSLVATGKQRISLAALQLILCECKGVERMTVA